MTIRKTISLHVTADEWRRFREACRNEGRSAAGVLSECVLQYRRVREAWFERLWQSRGLVERSKR